MFEHGHMYLTFRFLLPSCRLGAGYYFLVMCVCVFCGSVSKGGFVCQSYFGIGWVTVLLVFGRYDDQTSVTALKKNMVRTLRGL